MSIQLAAERAVDHAAPLPLYHQLKQWIAARILAGDLPTGSQLPGEFELCARFGVSRGVVRQALAELRYEGLVERRRGRGTFVAAPKTPQGLISGVRGLADDAAARGQTVESVVLRLREAPAGSALAARLAVEPEDTVVELERLRLLDGEPWVLVVSYLRSDLVPGLAARDLGGSESLYRILRDDYGLPIVASARRVEAAVTDVREAHLLRTPRGAPLLVLRAIGYTTNHRPLEYFVAHHRGDRTSFEVVLPGAPVEPDLLDAGVGEP